MSREIKQTKIEKDGKTVIVNKIDGAIVPNVTTNTPTSESDSQTYAIAGSTTPTPVPTPNVAQPTTTNTNGIPKTTINDGIVPNITAQSELPEATASTNIPSLPSAPTPVSAASIPTTDEQIEKKRLQSKFGIYDQNKIRDGIIPLVTANQVNPPNITPQLLPPDVNQITAFTDALDGISEPLSIFVPYIGALKDVDLGTKNLETLGCLTAGCLSDGTVTLTNGVFDVFPQTPTAAPFAQYDVANKKYVDDNIGSFLDLDDTINSYKNRRILYESSSAVVHSGNLTFNGTTLSTTALDVDNIGINGNTISNSAANTDIVMLPNGTGVVSVLGTTNYETNVTHDDDIPNKKYVDDAIAVEDLWDRVGITLSPSNANDNVDIGSGNYTTTGNVTAGLLTIDNIGIDGDTISNSDVDTDIIMLPDGTGVISVTGTTDYEDNVTDDDDIPNKAYVDDSIALSFVTITEATTLTTSNDVVLCDATSSPFAVELPLAATSVGKILRIKKIDSTENAVSLVGSESDESEIDDDIFAVIENQWEAVTVSTDGTDWYIL